MKRNEFLLKFDLEPSASFPPERLFARVGNITTDPMRLQALKFEHFVQEAHPNWPGAIVAHTPRERTDELHEYAKRHRCPSLEFTSWMRPTLRTVAIFKRPKE
jgi:hypothetical protein